MPARRSAPRRSACRPRSRRVPRRCPRHEAARSCPRRGHREFRRSNMPASVSSTRTTVSALVGNGRAGHDASGLTRAERPRREPAGGDGLDHAQRHRNACDVRRATRIAVHRGVVPRRERHRRDGVGGEHAVVRVEQRALHRGQCSHLREDSRDGVRHLERRALAPVCVRHGQRLHGATGREAHEDRILHAFDLAVRDGEVVAQKAEEQQPAVGRRHVPRERACLVDRARLGVHVSFGGRPLHA